MAMSRDVVLRLIGDADSAKRALQESANAAGVTVREYRRAETLQRQQANSAKRMAAEQAAAAQVVGSSMLKMGAVVAGGLALGIKSAIDWESSFAEVKKVMKDPAMFGTVEAQLRKLTTVLPVTHSEIAAVAASAAQLGVADADIAAFTKTMIMLGTTTNLSSTEAATSIARMSNIMGTSTSQASNLGSAIVYLGNNFATTESEIVAMALRLAGAGKQAGMTEADVLGMAAAFSSVGIEAEAGGTAISKFMTMIGNAARDGGSKLDAFAKLAGTSAKDFARQWASDPAAALASVVSGLGDMQRAGGDVNGTLDQLGITEQRMRDALLRSAGAGDLLTSAISGANNAFSENNALQQEAETRYQTTASQLQLLQNSLVEAGIGIGQALLPPLGLLVDAVKFVIDGFNGLPGPVKAGIGILVGLVGTSALVSGGILKIRDSVGEVSSAFSTMKGADGFIGKMGGFMSLLGPAGAVIGIATTAVSILSSTFGIGEPEVEGYTERVDAFASALQESKGAIDANVRALAAKNAADIIGGENAFNHEKAMKNLGLSMPEVTDAILDQDGAYDQVIGKIDDYIAGLDKNSNAYGGYKSQAEGMKGVISQLHDEMSDGAKKAKLQAEATGESADAMDGQASAAAEAGMSAEEYAQAQAEAADAADQTKKAVDELKNAFDALNGANLDALEATANMTLALSGMADAIEQNGTGLDANTESGAKNVQVLSDMVGKAEDVVAATLQQTGSLAEANMAYKEQRTAILDAAEAAGLNRKEVAALLDQIFQMPDELVSPVSLPGATEALAALQTLNAEAYLANDGSVQIKVEALTDEAKAELESLGFDVEELPDGSFRIIAESDAAEEALNAVKMDADLLDGADPTVVVNAITEDAKQALADVGAVVEQTPDGKVVKVDSLTTEAYDALTQYGFVLQSIPGEKGTIITAPGAPESQAAIDEVNKSAGTLSNGEQVPVSAPGAKGAKGDIDAADKSAKGLSNGEQVPVSAPGAKGAKSDIDAADKSAKGLSNGESVPVSAPGANTSAGQIQNVSNKANAVPSSKNVQVNANTAQASSNLTYFAGLLAGIPTSKTVTVNQVAGSRVDMANGGYLSFYANGGHYRHFANGGENHVAQFAPAGTWRVWAEDETGGEWYIPQALSKRGRSMDIAAQMLDSWGMAMVPRESQRYAYGTPISSSSSSSVRYGDRNFNVVVNASGDANQIADRVMAKIREREFLYGRGM